MSPGTTFLENFDSLTEMDGGIDQIRNLVIQIAVRGRLSKPLPGENSAASVLRAIAKRKVKNAKAVSKEKHGEIVSPHEIPDHWVWSRIGDVILSIVGGGTPSKTNGEYWNGEIPWASVKDLKSEKYLTSTEDKISESGLKNSSSNLIPKGRILVCTRMGLGKIVITQVEAAINQDLKALELPPEINTDYFYYFYKTLKIVGSGMTVAGIRQDDLLNFPMPIPPTPEQERVVARIEELLGLCDELESKIRLKQSVRQSACKSILKSLADASNKEEMKKFGSLLFSSFDLVTGGLVEIQTFVQEIMELSARGRFSRARDGAETAALLRELGVAEADQKITESKPFDLPEGWSWIKLNDICSVITDGEHLTPQYSSDGVPMLSAKHIGKNSVLMENYRFVPVADSKKMLKRCDPRIGDVLVVSRGGGIGRSIVCDKEGFCLMGSVLLFKLKPQLDPHFLLFFLQSRTGQRLLRGTSSYTAQQAIYISHLKEDFYVPICGRAEQQRTIKIVNELKALGAKLYSKENARLNVLEKLSYALPQSVIFRAEENPSDSRQMSSNAFESF